MRKVEMLVAKLKITMKSISPAKSQGRVNVAICPKNIKKKNKFNKNKIKYLFEFERRLSV